MESEEENELSKEVKDFGDLTSLCTLCVLETCPDAYRRSPRFSPPKKLSTINETSLVESLELDVFPKFIDTRNFEKFDEAPSVMTFSAVSKVQGKNLVVYREPSPPSFIDDDDEDLLSQSLRDILARLDPEINNNREEPSNIAKLSHRLSQQCFSGNNVSDPVEIAPEISADLVRKIADVGARRADLNRKFYDPDGHKEKKQVEVNDDKILNEEPARSYNSDIPDDMIPCKIRKLDEEPSRSKENKPANCPIDVVSKIPRKKPKIISDEIVVGYPITIIPFSSDKKIASINVAANETKNGNFHFDDEVLIVEDKIEKRKEAEKEDTEKKKIDKSWKNLEDVVEISRSLRIPPQVPHPIKSQKQRLPNLKTLQRNIDKGSKMLYETASDMAELSLLIDNVRDYYTPKETSKQLKPAKKDSSKTLVSTATQTKEQVSLENPLPSADNGIGDPDKRSTKIDESLGRPSTITVPKIRENDRETARKRFFNFEDRMKMEKKFHMERKTKIVDKREGITLNRNVIVDEYEQYWNPLRPRRWPKNRNNPQPLRNYSSPCQFPSLPVVIESTKPSVTKSAK